MSAAKKSESAKSADKGEEAPKVAEVEEAAPKGFLYMVHATDPHASLSHDGIAYEPDKNGKLKIPLAVIEDAKNHGFVVA